MASLLPSSVVANPEGDKEPGAVWKARLASSVTCLPLAAPRFSSYHLLLNFVGPFSPCFALDPMLMQSRLKWALPVLLPALSLSIASSASSYSSGTR
jgi:hypothetical protein